MKALTVPQPHASLLADGVITSLTYSRMAPEHHWGTTIGIRADSPRMSRDAIDGLPPWALRRLRSTLRIPDSSELLSELPQDVMIATASLTDCLQVIDHPLEKRYSPDAREWLPTMGTRCPFGYSRPVLVDGLGDYSAGSWVWRLHDVEKLPDPVPARGHQELWT